MDDPDSAGEWISSHGDIKVREDILAWLAWRTARDHGLKALALADRIETPEKRSKARLHSARWLGISRAKWAFRDTWERSGEPTRGGYPTDWTLGELRNFAAGTMENRPEHYPILIQHADSEEQRQSIHIGVIEGAGVSQPTLASGAVAALDNEALKKDPRMQQTLKAFFKRWQENEPSKAKEWLAQQPFDAKKTAMLEVLVQP